MLFQADDNTNGTELWITDGTNAGTSMLLNIKPNPFGSFPTNFAVIGAKAVFTASDATTSSRSLWVTDGTAGGTAPILSQNSRPLTKLTAFGTKAIFSFRDGTQGYEPWVTDGTSGGSTLIKDINPGTANANPSAFAAFGSQALFTAADGSPETASARAAFITDGTSAGTTKLTDAIIDQSGFFVIGNKALFTAFSAGHGYELWVTDGTPAGTSQLHEFAAGAASAPISDFGVLNNQVFFRGPGPSLTSAPWVSDGTDVGTHIIHAAAGSNIPTAFTAVTVPCFAAGTSIATPTGAIAVERLREGDLVTSAFGGAVAVQWVGHRHVVAARHPDPASIWPVRVAAGALAPGVPARDLFLSPEHALHIDGHLVPAILLCNGVSITQSPRQEVTYFHIELPQHDVVLAEGAGCESYLDTNNRADFANGGTVITARPNFVGDDANAIWLANACAPQCRNGPRLEAIRQALARRCQGEWAAPIDQPSGSPAPAMRATA